MHLSPLPWSTEVWLGFFSLSFSLFPPSHNQLHRYIYGPDSTTWTAYIELYHNIYGNPLHQIQHSYHRLLLLSKATTHQGHQLSRASGGFTGFGGLLCASRGLR